MKDNNCNAKFLWSYRLYCAGDEYKLDPVDITLEDAKAIFNILRTYSKFLNPTKRVKKIAKISRKKKPAVVADLTDTL
jgi:hypothetical protein